MQRYEVKLADRRYSLIEIAASESPIIQSGGEDLVDEEFFALVTDTYKSDLYKPSTHNALIGYPVIYIDSDANIDGKIRPLWRDLLQEKIIRFGEPKVMKPLTKRAISVLPAGLTAGHAIGLLLLSFGCTC